MEETNPEQTLADVESEFDKARADVRRAKIRLEIAKAKVHSQLVARRESGEKLTVEDMKALKALAFDENPELRRAYLDFVECEAIRELAKVRFNQATRDYWDSKGKM